MTKNEIILTGKACSNLKKNWNISKQFVARSSRKIKQAIDFGDISENSEYEDAKNEQAFIEGRIMSLRRPCAMRAHRR